jgi:hypothetical protein
MEEFKSAIDSDNLEAILSLLVYQNFLAKPYTKNKESTALVREALKKYMRDKSVSLNLFKEDLSPAEQ